jgi:hypothetical protein
VTEKENGGSAFPIPVAIGPTDDLYDGQGGMSLRDWFAGQALSGIFANPDISASAARLSVTTESFREDCARAAYASADAMLAERQK